jgi:MFS family permease
VSSSAVVQRARHRGDAVGRPQRAATFAAFVSHGLLFASWAAHIPHVKAHLGLTYGALGLALLGAPLGSVSAMMICTRLLPRAGSKRMVQISLLGYCLSGPLVGLAASRAELFAALFAWGAFQGTLDVSMNTQAVAVERAEGRPLMSGFHASWSIGAFAGAGIGAIGVAAGISLTQQLSLLAVPALAIAGPLTSRMLPDAGRPPGTDGRTDRRAAGRPQLRLSPPVLVLGAIAFASMLCEGASADWGSVYLRGPLHASPAIAGLAYTAFAMTMVMLRLCGNRLTARFQRRRLLPILAAIATAGFTAGLLTGTGAGGIAGFGFLGVGLALIIPTVNSASGQLPDLSPGAAIAMVSSCGWAGFVFGPPIIGELASATTLTAALGVLPLLTACMVVVTARTHALGPRSRRIDSDRAGDVDPVRCGRAR